MIKSISLTLLACLALGSTSTSAKHLEQRDVSIASVLHLYVPEWSYISGDPARGVLDPQVIGDTMIPYQKYKDDPPAVRWNFTAHFFDPKEGKWTRDGWKPKDGDPRVLIPPKKSDLKEKDKSVWCTVILADKNDFNIELIPEVPFFKFAKGPGPTEVDEPFPSSITATYTQPLSAVLAKESDGAVATKNSITCTQEA